MRHTFLLFMLLALLPLPAFAEDCCAAECCAELDRELVTVVFHLPLSFNDGNKVPEPLLEDLLADIVDLAGGFTYYEATGGWMFEGKLYREPIWVVKVGLKNQQVAGFEQMVEKRLKTDFKQEAVWLEESGTAEIL